MLMDNQQPTQDFINVFFLSERIEILSMIKPFLKVYLSDDSEQLVENFSEFEFWDSNSKKWITNCTPFLEGIVSDIINRGYFFRAKNQAKKVMLMGKLDFLYQTALSIAAKEFESIKDKAGEPYIIHLLTVCGYVSYTETKIVALLHDLLEDTDNWTESQLQSVFGHEITDAIVILTRKENETYSEFIDRIIKSNNKMAIEVKIADLTHNSDISRIKRPSKKDLERVEKYRKAKEKLLKLVN